MEVGLIVPVLSNFKGLAELMHSVDIPITPIIIDNWVENRGVAKGWNEGIRRGKDLDFLIIANDDVILMPGTIAKLIESLDTCDLVSVVATDTGQIGLHYGAFPDFCCYAIRPSFVDRFGTFDEKFWPAYFEDNDMSYRIKVGGGVAALRMDARVHHVGSVTQFSGPNEDGRVVTHQQFETNREYYATKWGGWPGQEQYAAPFNGMTGKTFKEW